MKTSELQGVALDWAVAKCLHGNLYLEDYSTDWAKGGPIIEREGILLRAIRKDEHAMNDQWLAMYDAGNTGSMVQWVKRTDWPRHYLSGTTPLIAAMRCYVTSKIGDEVEIPEELL